MSLKPSTPDRRHHFPHDHLPPSRIPQPSPQVLRRSLSLRLRNTTLNILDNSATHSKSPTKSPFSQRRRPNYSKNQLHGSKSLTNLGNMAENNGYLNGKVDVINGDIIPAEVKQSPTSVIVCCKQASKNCMAKSQHGMVSIIVLCVWLYLSVLIFFLNIDYVHGYNFTKEKTFAKSFMIYYYVLFPLDLSLYNKEQNVFNLQPPFNSNPL